MASYGALPEPALARSGRLSTSGDYAYEVKWDGFRAFHRRIAPCPQPARLDMTPHVTFLSGLPVRAVLDGELVTLDSDGKPDFPPDLRVPAPAPRVDPADVRGPFLAWSARTLPRNGRPALDS